MIRHGENSQDPDKYFKMLKYGGAKRNYVCAAHRVNKKEFGLCPICRQPMVGIGDRYKVPGKNDDAGWKKLKKDFKIRPDGSV